MESKLLDSKQYVPLQLEDVHVSIAKRIYSQLDLVVLFFNCISACFSIPSAVSLIPRDDDVGLYQFCTYGSPTAVYVQCPYLNSPTFFAFLAFCVLYFGAFFAFKVYWSIDYYSNDLRFFISCDVVNNLAITKVFIAIGLLFTVAGGLTGIGFVTINGSTDSIGSILTFVFVNFYTFMRMRKGQYRLTADSFRDLFPSPVPFTVPLALQSLNQDVTVSHRDLFEYICQACLNSALTGDDGGLKAIGDAQQLRSVINLLNEKRWK